jgi:hypothetical protein
MVHPTIGYLALVPALVVAGCAANSWRAGIELTVTTAGIYGERGQVLCLDQLPRIVDTAESGATVVLTSAGIASTSEALKVQLALQELGFEDVRLAGARDGWTLYPPASPGVELTACPDY